MSLISLAILLFRMAEESIGSLYMLLFIVLGCFLLELSYRTLTGRKMGEFIDSGLKKREKNLAEWESWVKNFAKNLSKLVEDVEIYLVGSHARGRKRSLTTSIFSCFPINSITLSLRRLREMPD